MPDRVKEKLVELLCHEYEYETYEDMADGMIAHGVTVQEWIPVSERLPRCGERVLIASGNAVFEAYLSISNKWVRCGIGWAENITHWMPLPKPPEGE